MNRFAHYRHLSGAVLTVAGIGLGLALSTSASAQTRILVGFPAGGNVDVVARHLADGLREELGQNIVVENKAGAGGQIAAATLKQSAPDGNTLFLSNEHAVAIVPLTMKNPGYKTATDFVPVATVATMPIILAVNPGIQVSSLQQFGAWAKQQSASVNVGVPAPASQPDFAVSLVGNAFGAKLTSIAYRGGAPMVSDLVGGQIHAGITGVTELLPHARAGKLRLLAVSGSSRSPLLPDVPTFAEAGVKGLDEPVFMGLFAPAGTPAAVIQRYNDALGKVLKRPAFAEQLRSIGVQAMYGGPDDLKRRVDSQTMTWGRVVKELGFQPQ